LSLHAAGELLRAGRTEARRAIAHLQRGLYGGADRAALCQAILRRAADAPDEEVRRLALFSLLPSEAPERIVSTLRHFLDRLGPAALREDDFAPLGERTLEPSQIEALFGFLSEQAARNAHGPSERRAISASMRLLTTCALLHPRWYAQVRIPLARLSHHAEEEIAAHAREELDRLRRGFSNWIGPNVRRALDPESGAEYGWKDVTTFDEEVDAGARELLLRAIAETTMLRASVFLFGRGALLSLADVRTVHVTRLGSASGKSVYRLSVETRVGDVHELCANVSESLHPMALREEMDWLLAAGATPRLPPIVEAFGGYYPELGVFTEEYVPGQHVEALAARLVHLNEGRRLRTLWPFLAQSAFRLSVAFWDRTGRTIALAAPAPAAFVVPAHDYQGGARLVSIARRAPCDGIDALLDRFVTSFVAPLEERYPELRGEVDDALLLAAAVEALGVDEAREVLSSAKEGPHGDAIRAALARLDAEGHTALRIADAVRRYRRWISVNPQATLEARGVMLGELWSTYRLAEIEARAYDTRVRFFRQTVFADARPELAAELDRLMARARVARLSNLDLLGEQLEAHRAAVKPTPEEDYFLARMTFRYLEPSDEASLIAIPAGEKKLATVVMGLRDESGERFFVRRPTSPREVARVLQLFHDANLAVSFQADSEVLLAIDARDEVLGGLFWHWRKPGAAQMDKMVVARKHRGKGVGDGLLRELLRRMRGRGARTVSIGYWQAEYFKRYGFRTDPTSGGLVVDIDAVPGTVPPPEA
jgi:GNAT superfamily N-acetyltransferase